jgi:hypothetical protein
VCFFFVSQKEQRSRDDHRRLSSVAFEFEFEHILYDFCSFFIISSFADMVVYYLFYCISFRHHRYVKLSNRIYGIGSFTDVHVARFSPSIFPIKKSYRVLNLYEAYFSVSND